MPADGAVALPAGAGGRTQAGRWLRQRPLHGPRLPDRREGGGVPPRLGLRGLPEEEDAGGGEPAEGLTRRARRVPERQGEGARVLEE
eukprot:4534234-Alexandrium_andersonii.AAC.1